MRLAMKFAWTFALYAAVAYEDAARRSYYDQYNEAYSRAIRETYRAARGGANDG